MGGVMVLLERVWVNPAYVESVEDRPQGGCAVLLRSGRVLTLSGSAVDVVTLLMSPPGT